MLVLQLQLPQQLLGLLKKELNIGAGNTNQPGVQEVTNLDLTQAAGNILERATQEAAATQTQVANEAATQAASEANHSQPYYEKVLQPGERVESAVMAAYETSLELSGYPADTRSNLAKVWYSYNPGLNIVVDVPGEQGGLEVLVGAEVARRSGWLDRTDLPEGTRILISGDPQRGLGQYVMNLVKPPEGQNPRQVKIYAWDGGQVVNSMDNPNDLAIIANKGIFEGTLVLNH